jgi:very-short-patch-repair endonuclease
MSAPEELFYLHCKANKIEVVREYKFHPTRKWRADFAIPEKMILIEIEGGVWIKSRHTTGAGYTADCEKYNEATLCGWHIFRFTPDIVKSGAAIGMIEKYLQNGS